MSGHYRVLTINGGGVRGLVPAVILKKLTDDSGKPIHELFDYIVGTSIGGIIAASLAVSDENGNPKYTTQDVVDILTNEAQNIFPANTIGNYPVIGHIHNLFLPKYSRDGIDGVLNQKLGNATFLDTVIPITTVSYSLDQDQPRVWSTFKAQLDQNKYNYFLKDAAGATSAAPTYFPPKITKAPNGELYHDIDGGVFANSPTFLGISQLLTAHPELDINKLIVVSIGTGAFEDTPIKSDSYSTPFIDQTTDFTAGIISLAVGGLITCAPWGNAPKAVGAAIFAVGAYLITNVAKFGQVGWVVTHDLISKMMKGTELSDTIEALSFFKSIWINPRLDNKFAPLDASNPEHMKNFTDVINMVIETNDNIWKHTIDCLNSKSVNSAACANARETAYEAFRAEFKYEGLDNFIDDLTTTGDLPQHQE